MHSIFIYGNVTSFYGILHFAARDFGILYEREPARTRTTALDTIEAILSRMPSSYMLLKSVQVEVEAGQDNGPVKMRYVPTNSETDAIEVNGKSIVEAERLMRSALGEAWRRYTIMTKISPHVNDKVQAIGKELSDLIEH